MPTASTPTWSQVTVQDITTLERLEVKRFVLDLKDKWGAYVYFFVGRGGTTALTTNGIVAQARRLLGESPNNDSIPMAVAGDFMSELTAAASTTCAASGNDAGVNSLVVASSASFAVGDQICIGAGASTEWKRVSSKPDSTHLMLDSPTRYAHNDTGHTVRNKAESWMAYLEGGAEYELILDYGGAGAGDTATIKVAAHVLGDITNE